jgi:hypothetical protein
MDAALHSATRATLAGSMTPACKRSVSGGAPLDDRHAAGELGDALLQLLPLVVAVRVGELTAQLADARLNGGLLAGPRGQRGVLPRHDDALRTPEIGEGHVFDLDAELFARVSTPLEMAARARASNRMSLDNRCSFLRGEWPVIQRPSPVQTQHSISAGQSPHTGQFFVGAMKCPATAVLNGAP